MLIEIRCLTEKYTAEQWIVKSNYTPTRLISLLDLEIKLIQSGKTSNKMIAVRKWLNELLQSYITDSTPQYTWPPAPHSYEDTIQEALSAITA